MARLPAGLAPARVARLLPGLALALGVAAPAAAQDVRVDAGGGTSAVVERRPFRITLVDAAGREAVATVPAGLPGVRAPGADGPQPAEPLGRAGGFPALAWVTGVQLGATWPLPAFTGNRIFGAEAGALVSVVAVQDAAAVPGGVRLRLRTDAPGGAVAEATLLALPGGGVRLRAAPPPGLPGVVATVVTIASPPGEGLFGLGARKDAFDQRGRLRNVWTEEQNASDERAEPVTCRDATGTTGCDYTFPNGAQAAYYVQSALFGARGWAAWSGRTELTRLDLAATRPDAVRIGTAAPQLDLSLAAGGLEPASRAYTAAAGRAPAPPRYVYEPWIDVINEGEGEAAPNGSGFTGGARVRAELEGIVREARAAGLPLGVLGVEGWHRVPGGEAFFAGLRRAGFRLSAYWNPFTSPGTPAYAEAERLGILVRDPTGRPYQLVNNRGGRVAVIDFSHPAAAGFWKRQLDRSRALGFEAFMHDFGEFVTEGMRFHDGTPPEAEHNRYPVRLHAAARAAIDAQAREQPGFEPWFYVRAGFDGVTRSTSGVFPGDETTDYSEGSGLPSVVPAMLNLALGGSYTFTTDVGGYFDLLSPRTSPELMARWAQLAALTPVSRIHDSTFSKSVYPWELGSATLDAYRRYARLKVRLVPLVDAWSRRAATEGAVGPVRPLVLDDPALASVDDQWLLGRDLLVAPVLERGARSRPVRLPAGARWQRVVVGADGELVPRDAPQDGGRTVTAPAPFGDIPLYVRAGARTEVDRLLAGSPRCAARPGFRRVGARGSGRALRLSFARAVRAPVTVDVFLQSRGRELIGERRVARFRGRTRGVRWAARGARDGVYVARFTIASPTGRADVRRVALERRRGRWRRLPAYAAREGCALLPAAKLERPVFGGRRPRPLRVAFRTGRTATVGVVVRRGGRVVRRFPAVERAAGRIHRLRIAAEPLARGTYRVTITARAGGERAVRTLVARRL